jgi:hypothetical protein
MGDASSTAESAASQVDADAIAARIDDVRERIEQACQRAGRSSDEITVVAVSKTFPLRVTEIAHEHGIDHFGENRARALRDKAKELPGACNGGSVHWHMIGHLQTNKAKFVARHADAFECLDSPRLADELDMRAAKNDRALPCLVQVNVTRQDRKYGVLPEDVHDYLDHLAQYDYLDVQGLMAMASFVDDPEEVRGEFREVRELFETYDASDNPTVAMNELSIGMTNDFEVAIEEGSTRLRLGTAIFGPRDYD